MASDCREQEPVRRRVKVLEGSKNGYDGGTPTHKPPVGL